MADDYELIADYLQGFLEFWEEVGWTESWAKLEDGEDEMDRMSRAFDEWSDQVEIILAALNARFASRFEFGNVAEDTHEFVLAARRLNALPSRLTDEEFEEIATFFNGFVAHG